MSDVTVTNEPPLGNDQTVRTPDGTIRDQGVPPPQEITTPTPKTEPTTPPSTEPKAADAPREGDAPKPAAGAPEKYADFTVPDGFKFDDKVLPEVQATFKELNLSQDQGQKLVDFYTKNFREASEAPYKAWADTQKQWSDEITSRFGDRADTIRGDINSAINTALPPSTAKAFRAALDLTGAGTNPDVVEAFSILLRPHFEGTPVVPGKVSGEANKPPGQGPVSIADAMYGHLRK